MAYPAVNLLNAVYAKLTSGSTGTAIDSSIGSGKVYKNKAPAQLERYFPTFINVLIGTYNRDSETGSRRYRIEAVFIDLHVSTQPETDTLEAYDVIQLIEDALHDNDGRLTVSGGSALLEAVNRDAEEYDEENTLMKIIRVTAVYEYIEDK